MPGTLLPLASFLLVALTGAAQVVPPTPAAQPPAAASPAPAIPDAGFSSLLPDVERAATTLRNHLSQVEIDRWKTNAAGKRQAAADATSLNRNLVEALPGMVGQVRSTPTDLAAAFKLYRDLNALYEVLSSLTQSAGASAPAEESAMLAGDVSQLDNLRRSLADQLEQAAAMQQAQVNQMQDRIQALAAAAAATPPKKIVVDDNEPAPKPAKKKKPLPPKPQNPQEKQ